MRDAGFSALTIEQLINAWDHGISGDDARELGAVGLGKLPLEQLILRPRSRCGGGLRTRDARARPSCVARRSHSGA